MYTITLLVGYPALNWISKFLQGGAGGLTHGWVDSDLVAPTFCPAAANSAIFPSAHAEAAELGSHQTVE